MGDTTYGFQERAAAKINGSIYYREGPFRDVSERFPFSRRMAKSPLNMGFCGVLLGCQELAGTA